MDNPVNFPVNNVLNRLYTPGQTRYESCMVSRSFRGSIRKRQFSRIHPHVIPNFQPKNRFGIRYFAGPSPFSRKHSHFSRNEG